MSSGGVQAGPSMGFAELQSSAGGKVKQTRRRQRLSCVECTKRRQKCDRQIPCGLCTTRGIPHLCRWEPIVVRPTPQRPPIQAQMASPGQPGTVEALLARVSALEEALRSKETQQKHHQDSPTSSASVAASPGESGESGIRSSPEMEAGSECASGDVPPQDSSCELKLLEKKDGPVALIDFDVQVAAVALAQLSLAPRTEYVGAGTVLCALHRLGDPELCKLPYPHSTMMRTRKRESDEHPIVSPIRCLLAQLPVRNEVENLITIFFSTRNMEFGISEVWFRSATQTMWYHMDKQCAPGCSSNGGCPSCQEEVNPHWLTLFYGILAITPFENGSQIRAIFFNNALASRRLIEDILLASPAAMSDSSLAGSVLSCLASAVLSVYLADHGRVSEAWKIVGGALRCGQAIGLHRDTQWRRWEKMGGVETELRTLTWWLLVCADRQYSFVLGRPVMSQRGTFETSTLPAAQHGDGSPNPHVLYRKHMCKLSELISDSTMKCLQWEAPTYRTISELYDQYKKWEEQLPARFKWRSENLRSINDDDATRTPPRLLAYQRVLLAAWWLDTVMGIHRIYLMDSPPASGHPDGSSAASTSSNPAREKCIEFAMELTRVLVQFYEESLTWPARERMAPSFFQYFLFDGAVALAGALSQVPPHPQSAECLDLMNKSMHVLEDLAREAENAVDGEGETAKRGITVLKALVRAGGWERSEREKGALVSFDDLERSQRIDGDTFIAPHMTPVGSASPPEFFQRSPTQFFQTSARFSQREQVSADGSPLSVPASPPKSSASPQSSMSLPSNKVFATPPLPAASFSGSYRSPGSSSASAASTELYPVPGLGNLHTGLGPRPLAPQPSMVMPYDVLQGVSSSSQQTANFDIDWARLAGMDHWYSGGMGSYETGAVMGS